MKAPDLNVVSVINPGVDDEIEIRPQEILQVAFVNCHKITWTLQDQKSPIHLKALRTETFINDGFDRNVQGNFQVVPYTKRLGDYQQHFWFRINPADDKRLQDQRQSYQQMTTIVFHDNTGKLVGQVKVYLVMEQEDVDEFICLMEQTCWAGRDLIFTEAATAGLQHKIDEENGYILNPGWNESIDIECKQRNILIELSQSASNCTYSAKWEATSHKGYMDHAPNFSLKEAEPRYINGIQIQRFILKNHVKTLNYGIKRMRLGELVFKVNEVPRKIWEKRINLSVIHEREPNYFAGSEYDCDEGDEAYYFQRRIENYMRVKPRRVPVKIEEIKGSLTEGTKLLQVFHPKPVFKLSTFEIADPKDNHFINYPGDEELIIMLYKDPTTQAPDWKQGEWELTCEGKLLRFLYVLRDDHHQKFSFAVHGSPTAHSETLLFTMRGKRKHIHVIHTPAGIYQPSIEKIKKIIPPAKDERPAVTNDEVEKVMEELLAHPIYSWRTITSIAHEVKLEQEKVYRILEIQRNLGKVKQHSRQIGLWAHEGRAVEEKESSIED